MKLSISNIAWGNEYDEEMYQYLVSNHFQGIEIAPTRLVANNPYDNIDSSKEIVNLLKEKYNLNISSMQSIWFGRHENIFGSDEERRLLIEHTKKAIHYARAIGSENLVFGCPKNRNMDDSSKYDVALEFFKELGDYANQYGVVIALEPNPVIYNTNFLNKTEEAIDFVRKINSKGLQINLDLGTVIWNNEDLDKVLDDIEMIHHIHISEPNLAQIEKRELHYKLKNILQKKEYGRYVSIEMKNLNDINIVKKTIDYINEVMG